MKKTILVIAVLAALGTNYAHAAEVKPEHETSMNAAVSSDYRYRGISQTPLKPALSGGADYTHTPSGLYAGVWASTIKWTKDAGGGGDVEIDVYAGKRGQLSEALSYDIGVLSYAYPSNGLANLPGFVNANTTEVYGQLGYGPGYLKYSHALTNLFGFVDSKNSGYIDLGANVELTPGTVLNLHAGRQEVNNASLASYTDWKVGITQDLGFASGALALVGTNASKAAYASPANGKFMGKNALVISLGKTF